MKLITIGEYSIRAQRLLYNFVLANPGCERLTIETTSPFKTVHDLLAHSIGAETRWMARILGEPLPEPRYEENAPREIEALRKDWQRYRKRTMTIIQAATSEELLRQIPYTLPGWVENGSLSFEEMVYHVFNHENYHRGQCSMILQQNGFEPPQFDYPLTLGQIE